MKAIVIDGYGGIDRLRLDERPDPVPGPGEVLINVRAASVNPVDWKIREGELRLFLWLRFPYIPGGDVAGEVAAIGPGVTRFQPGDPVVAFVELKRGGGYAEARSSRNRRRPQRQPPSASPRRPACRSRAARPPGVARPRRAPSGGLGADQRRRRRRRPLRRPDRQGDGRDRRRDLRPVQRRVRPVARRRPGHRLLA